MGPGWELPAESPRALLTEPLRARPLGTVSGAEAACEESRSGERAKRRAVRTGPLPAGGDRAERSRCGLHGAGPSGSPGGGSLLQDPPLLRVASPAPPCGGVPGALRFSHKSGPNSWERAILHRALLTENENQTGPEINHGAQRLHKGRLCVNRAGRGGQLPAARVRSGCGPSPRAAGLRGRRAGGCRPPSAPAAVPRWLPEHGGWRQGRISVFVCLRPLARGRLQHSAPARLMEQLAALVLIASPRARPPAAAAATGLPAAGPRAAPGCSLAAVCAAAPGLLLAPRARGGGSWLSWLRCSIRTASSIHYNNPLSKQSAEAAGTTRPCCKQSSGDAANDINKITINSPVTPAQPAWESPRAASRAETRRQVPGLLCSFLPLASVPPHRSPRCGRAPRRQPPRYGHGPTIYRPASRLSQPGTHHRFASTKEGMLA